MEGYSKAEVVGLLVACAVAVVVLLLDLMVWRVVA